jgi:hypothetical protein
MERRATQAQICSHPSRRALDRIRRLCRRMNARRAALAVIGRRHLRRRTRIAHRPAGSASLFASSRLALTSGVVRTRRPDALARRVIRFA